MTSRICWEWIAEELAIAGASDVVVPEVRLIRWKVFDRDRDDRIFAFEDTNLRSPNGAVCIDKTQG